VSANRSVELVFRLRTEGQQQTEAALRSFKGLADQVAKGSHELRVFDAANARVAEGMNRGARAVKSFDVGIGSLLDSARKASKELLTLQQQNDRHIQSIERQAALLGVSGSSRIDLQRRHAIADYGKTAADIGRINAAFRLMQKAGEDSNSTINLGVLGLGRYAGAAGAVTAVVGTFTAALSLTDKALTKFDADQRLERSLTRAAGGNRLLAAVTKNQVRGLARESDVLDFDSINQQVTRLGAYGFSVAEIPGVLRTVSDASAELGPEKMESIVRALGQIRAKGRVQQEELLQLQEAGISAGAILAKAFGKSQAALNEMVERGVVPADKAVRALLDGINDRFAGAGSNISSYRGQLNQLSDTFDSLLASFGQELSPTIIPVLKEINSLLSAISAVDVIGALELTVKSSPVYGLVRDIGSVISGTRNLFRDAQPSTGTQMVGQRFNTFVRGQDSDIARTAAAFNTSPGLTQDAAMAGSLRIRSPRADEEATSEAKRHAKQVRDAELAATIELAKIEAGRLPELEKIIALNEIEKTQLREKGILTQKLSGLLDRQLTAHVSDVLAGSASNVNGLPLRSINARTDLDRRLSGITDGTTRLFADMPGFAHIFESTLNAALPLPGSANNSLPQNFAQATLQNIYSDRQFALATERQDADLAGRRISAFAQPGDEVNTINSITSLRIKSAERIRSLEGDSLEARRRAELDIGRLREEREISLAELRQRNAERYREDAGRVWDAITSSGQGGLRTFITGQANQQGRALFQNISGKGLEAFGSRLGSIGASSGLPAWLLRGTLADPQNAQLANITALDKNTISTDQLTAALQQTVAGTATIGRSGIPGFDGGIVPAFESGRTVASYFRGSGTNSRLGEFGFGASTAAGGLFAGLRGGQITRGDQGYVLTGSEKFGNTVASAGIFAGAAFGIYGGIKQGGARGISQAVASGLGAAAAIPGPQQPFLAAAALAAGVIGSLLPDPKKQREEEINRRVSERRYEDPRGTDRYTDMAGRETGYDSRGRVRIYQTININAMDAKSILDHRHAIAAATTAALNEGGTDLGDAVRSQISRY
jgi:tape measure domain-containing protein